MDVREFKDPLKLGRLLWPDVYFYSKQREIIYSVWENKLTSVPAAHMVGKDFVAGFIALAFFLTRHPCRILTTSVDHYQLAGVLWGEIRRFIQTSKFPLTSDKGGPLVVNHMHIRKLYGGEECGLSYLLGRVAKQGEGLSGHHIANVGDGIPRTLAMFDEASGIDQESMSKCTEWANRRLMIGNPYDCVNEFYWSVEGREETKDPGGDVPNPDGNGFLRKVIHITAEDSPNVQLARLEQRKGMKPSDRIVVPGVLPWSEFENRDRTWDEAKKAVGLKARFYKGKELRLYPDEWLQRAFRYAPLMRKRDAKAIGVDPAEGGDKTALAAVDEHGLIELLSLKTPDTSVIPGLVAAFARKHGVRMHDVVFDRGGGGKQHADNMRAMGNQVRTVGFGESVVIEPKRGLRTLDDRIKANEARYAYFNRRAQMYGQLRQLLEPTGEGIWAIPPEYAGVLGKQLRPIPLKYDKEGRLRLPPKHKTKGVTEPTLVDLIGHSPDEADAVVLAIHGMLHKSRKAVAGVA